jgi:hypothetical protein
MVARVPPKESSLKQEHIAKQQREKKRAGKKAR